MKTLKSTPVFIVALCLLVACSEPYGIGENDIVPNNSGGQIAITDNPVKVIVTHKRSEDAVSEETVDLKDLLNSSENDQICLYSADGQDLTLVPTVCDYMTICSSDLVGVRLYYNGFAGTGTDSNTSSGEVTAGKSPIKVKVTYSLSEERLSEEILGLHDFIKSSGTDSICLFCIDGQDLTLVETTCVSLCISSKDIIKIALFTE